MATLALMYITRVAPDVRSALHSMGYIWLVINSSSSCYSPNIELICFRQILLNLSSLVTIASLPSVPTIMDDNRIEKARQVLPITRKRYRFQKKRKSPKGHHYGLLLKEITCMYRFLISWQLGWSCIEDALLTG
jgi:hypothetical protein